MSELDRISVQSLSRQSALDPMQTLVLPPSERKESRVHREESPLGETTKEGRLNYMGSCPHHSYPCLRVSGQFLYGRKESFWLEEQGQGD